MDTKESKMANATKQDVSDQTKQQIEALRILIAAAVKAQSQGVFTLDESHNIHLAVQRFKNTNLK